MKKKNLVKPKVLLSEDVELYCNNCDTFTTYEKVIHGTMKLTENYTKEITFCPHCFTNNCLEDVT